MNRKRFQLWCLAILLWAAAPLLCVADPSQSSTQQASSTQASPNPDITIKSQVNWVVVDVVVTGHSNEPVKGLGQQDFQIFEDKKPQQVRSFEVHEAQPVTSPARELPPNTFSNAASIEPGTINIILLDQVHTQISDQEFGREELLKYLKQKPADVRCAIYVLDGNGLQVIQGITADNAALIAAVSRKGAQPKLPTLHRVDLPVVNTSLLNDSSSPLAALAEIANSFQNVPGHKNLLWLSGEFEADPGPQQGDIMFPPKFSGWQKVDLNSETQLLHLVSGRLALERIAVHPIDVTGLNTRITWTALLPGSCQGPDVFPSLLPDINNVGGNEGSYRIPTFYECGEYPVTKHGASLESVAEETGGQAFHNTNGIEQAITQSVSQGASYYTLSYSPSNRKFDGKIRNIKVTLNQKGYHLAYRRKYYADDPSTLIRPYSAATGTTFLSGNFGPKTAAWVATVAPPKSHDQDPTLAAMQYGTPEQQGIVFTAHLKAVGGPVLATPQQMLGLQQYEAFRLANIAKAVASLTSKQDQKALRSKDGVKITTLPPLPPVRLQRYSIKYSVPATAVNLSPSGDKQTGALEIAIIAFDDSGKRLNGAGEVVDLGFTASQLEKFLSAGFHTRQTIDVPEQTAVLRLAVRDISSNKMGSIEIPMASISSP